MAPQLAFQKITPDGLSVEVIQFEGVDILMLAKNIAGAHSRPAQVLGVAGIEVNTPSLTWYYEYGPLPRSVSISRLSQWLTNHGYTLGTFDQYGNFQRSAAA